MADQSQLRVSDADRERTAAALREHYAVGRLDGDELEERLQAAYASRTHADLRELERDLPQLPGAPVPVPEAVLAERAALAERRGQLQRQVLHRAGGGVGLFVICSVIWVAAGAHGSFWPIWALAGTALVLVRSSWNLWGPAPDLDRVERDLDRRRRERRASRRRLQP